METPLSKLGKGKTGIVKSLEKGFGFRVKVFSLGIRIGKKIKVISLQPFRGPIVVKIDNTKIALGRGMAEKIIVEVK